MLYFIPTPIGNKEDITMRALRLIKEISIFLCEDTATCKKLLNLYEISLEGKLFYPYTSFTNPSKLQHYLNLITASNVCVLSEAGTPGLSDPGKSIVKLARENNIPFEVIPGATALIPAIVWAYTDTSSFTFYGFLPQKKWRKSLLQHIVSTHTASNRRISSAQSHNTLSSVGSKETPRKINQDNTEPSQENTRISGDTLPCFFYESVHRIEKLLTELSEMNFSGSIYLARELSKLFEQKLKWTPEELLAKIRSGELILKGEFVVGIR